MVDIIKSEICVRQAKAQAISLGKRDEFPVEGTPGLSLRVTPKGVASWAVRYRRPSDRKDQRLTLGRHPTVTLKDARATAAPMMLDIKLKDADPVGDRQTRKTAVTFAGLHDQWAAFKKREGRTDKYLYKAGRHIANLPDWFRDLKADEIKRNHVTAVLEEHAKRGATTEVNRLHATVSGVLSWALSEGLVTANVADGVKKRFREESRDRVLTGDEVKKFWCGLDSAAGERASVIAMRLCFVLGQRPKEMCELRRDRLALEALQPTATIVKGSAKNGLEHDVPLPRRAVELLREAVALAGDSEWVFPSPKGDGPIERDALTKIITRARAKDGTIFGIADAQLYDAKTTMATFLGEQGYLDDSIALILNHKRRGVTQRYNRAVYMPQKRTMIELWAKHLDEVLGQAPTHQNVIALAGR